MALSSNFWSERKLKLQLAFSTLSELILHMLISIVLLIQRATEESDANVKSWFSHISSPIEMDSSKSITAYQCSLCHNIVFHLQLLLIYIKWGHFFVAQFFLRHPVYMSWDMPLPGPGWPRGQSRWCGPGGICTIDCVMSVSGSQ